MIYILKHSPDTLGMLNRLRLEEALSEIKPAEIKHLFEGREKSVPALGGLVCGFGASAT